MEAKFAGCLIGGAVGDMIGAVVEGESAGYIRRTFGDIESILASETAPELFGGAWVVGRTTDDTRMTIDVAEWLARDDITDGRALLERFAASYDPERRYGPGTRMILALFGENKNNWQRLSTAMYPAGSYGNGSAMRAAPIGLRFRNDPGKLLEAARLSSSTTHSHPLAVQGASLQAAAVALAVGTPKIEPGPFLQALRKTLEHFARRGQDTRVFGEKLGAVQSALESGDAAPIGSGVAVYESVPAAIYCFLASPESFGESVARAVFMGDDADTVASMTGAISGAYLGEAAIPRSWIGRFRENPGFIDSLRSLARSLVGRS